MSARAERTNHVTSASLEQREPANAPADVATVQAELAALRGRIAAAAVVQPQPHELHCRDCFNRGRDAAIRAIAGK